MKTKQLKKTKKKTRLELRLEKMEVNINSISEDKLKFLKYNYRSNNYIKLPDEIYKYALNLSDEKFSSYLCDVIYYNNQNGLVALKYLNFLYSGNLSNDEIGDILSDIYDTISNIEVCGSNYILNVKEDLLESFYKILEKKIPIIILQS